MLSELTIKRFWERAKRNSHGYLVWTGGKTTAGYGELTGPASRPLYAHRVAFEIYNGRPPLAFVCHHCDRPACVDERCLFEGSHKDNVADAVRKGRNTRGERSAQSILTERDVHEIRQVASFVPRGTLAKAYGVSWYTIQDVVLRRNWAWLD